MAKATPVHSAPAEPEVQTPEVVEAPAESVKSSDPFARERARAEIAGYKVQDVAGVGKAQPALRIDY
jgi:hypothetical protein